MQRLKARARSAALRPRYPRPVAPTRIVSGGQTGVDRAALDHAIAAGIPYGGWCPRGGCAEDLPDPPGLLARYPQLEQALDADPAQRTAWNVRDSDATLVLTVPGMPSPGTDATIDAARRLGRPHAVVGVDDVAAARRFVAGVDGTLNVAGPRESEAPGVYERTRVLLRGLQESPDA